MKDILTSISVGKKPVDCIVNRASPDKFPGSSFVLGHGASGDASTGNLPAIAERLCKAGVTVVRYNCSGQLPARVKSLQAILDSDNEALGGIKAWILSGHSMGGRTACAVARDRSDVSGVVLFSYPLHPPGKETPKYITKQELRDKDLVALTIPVLIVRGTKDAFSKEEQFNSVKPRMQSSQLQIHAVDKGDHSLGTKTQAGKARFEEWMQTTEDFVNSVFSEGRAAEQGKKTGSGEVKQQASSASDQPAKQQKGAKGQKRKAQGSGSSETKRKHGKS